MHGLLKELNFSLPENVVEDGGGREGRTRKWVREPVAEVSRSKIMKSFVCQLNEWGLCHKVLGGKKSLQIRLANCKYHSGSSSRGRERGLEQVIHARGVGHLPGFPFFMVIITLR